MVKEVMANMHFFSFGPSLRERNSVETISGEKLVVHTLDCFSIR